MKYKVIIVLISIIFLVGISSLLPLIKTKVQPQDSVSGLYSISIKDINEIDKYPDVKEFLIKNGHYEKLQESIKGIHISESEHANKERLDKEIQSAIIDKYSLEQPNQTKLNNIGVTIIIEYGRNKVINDVQLKNSMK